MGQVTYDSLMRIPRFIKVVQEFRAPGTQLQRFYRTGLKFPAVATIEGRTGFYDVFSPTRQLPTSRAPLSGPSRINRVPVGQKAVTVMRNHEAMMVTHEELYGTRRFGRPYGVIDRNGQGYLARQIAEVARRYVTLHEFMTAAVFFGGWKLVPDGEDLLPVPITDSRSGLTVSSNMPVSHTGLLPVGPGATNLLGAGAYWDDPTADLIDFFTKLQFYVSRVNGRPIRHVWGTGPVLKPLLKNTKLQAVGGSVFRTWDNYSVRQEVDPGKGIPDGGVDFSFRALPEITFHVYDEGFTLPKTGQTIDDQISESNFVRFIPDKRVIMTPNPSLDWIGRLDGGEPMIWDKGQAEEYISGFGMGMAKEIEPPRTDVKSVNNSAVVIQEQYVAFAPQVQA